MTPRPTPEGLACCRGIGLSVRYSLCGNFILFVKFLRVKHDVAHQADMKGCAMMKPNLTDHLTALTDHLYATAERRAVTSWSQMGAR